MISFILNIDEENQKRISKFLESFEEFIKVNNDKLELILIVKPEQKSVINKFLNLNKKINVKIVYSVKTLSINKQLKFASKIASNDYIWWLDSNVKYNMDLLSNIIKIVKNDNVDLIEVLPCFDGMIKWNPKVRHDLKPLTILNILENENIVAYMFPFIANKIFNKKIALSILNEKKFNDIVDYSTPLSIEFLYQYALKSKTYVWISKQTITINIKENTIPHYNHIFNEWVRLNNYYESNRKYISELKYAEAYYLLIILTSIYATKNISNIFNDFQIYKKKYYDKLNKLFQNEMKSFDSENKYMINKNNNNENLFLKQIPQISKWNKLLLKL